MHACCRAHGRLDIGRLSVGLSTLLMTGRANAAPPLDTGLLTLAVLALVLTGLLALGLGVLLGQRKAERGLRRARSELQAMQQLRAAWLWRTDASHNLLTWQAPGGPLARHCMLFEAMDGLLASHLHAQQAFSNLQLLCVAPVAGALRWELRGVPQHDDLGAFAGFVGHALPLPDETEAQAGAALAAMLAVWPGAAVVALQEADGHWQARYANAAARALWSSLPWPVALDTLARQLPAPAADALRAALADGGMGSAAAPGWEVQGFVDSSPHAAPSDTRERRGLLLTQAMAEPAGSASERNDESDNFSFTASHDLRAPIRVVEGFTRIVKEDYGHLLDRVGNDHLDRVLGAAARMNLMIDALLTLARLSQQPLARQPVNLSLLAGYIVDDLRRASPDREVEIDIQPGLGSTGDPTLLRLVLENLLGNAWKYSARSERAQISLGTTPHHNGLAYVVRDNGAGFDMRSADRLFGLFQRLHSASDFPGHGVGLASVRRIIHRHGGEIWADAELGRGAAFFFTLAS